MAEPRTREPHTVIPDAQGSASDRDDDALIARVCAARQAGDEDTQGVEELLRRAADRNRAALDRLAQ